MIPVHDVSGGCFVYGINNFCLQNMLSALRSVGIIEREKLFATVNITVYDNLAVSGQLDYYPDKIKWVKFEVTVDPNSVFDKSVVDSYLTDGKKTVILRTREY